MKDESREKKRNMQRIIHKSSFVKCRWSCWALEKVRHGLLLSITLGAKRTTLLVYNCFIGAETTTEA